MAEIRANYAALVAMCDEYFGKLLDWMDETNSWENTALILTTDHGYLLGEHEWWAKNKMPYYEEIAHIPMMIWHPDNASRSGERVASLAQTTDIMPTILDFHDIPIPGEVTAFSLIEPLTGGENTRKHAILGMFAGPICVTDGTYSYYHYPEDLASPAPPMYNVMPSHLDTLFSVDEMSSATMADPFSFTKGTPVMRMTVSPTVGETGMACVANWEAGPSLYDLRTDARQENPIDEPSIRTRLTAAIVDELTRHDAPTETYPHYGLTTQHTNSADSQ